VGTALFEAKDLRIDVHGVAAVDGLSVATGEGRVVLIGAGRALFDAMGGLAQPVRGSLAVQGLPAASALAAGLVASAPADPAFPPTWTPLSYATWSARLAGLGRAEAKASAERALERMGMKGHAGIPLGQALLALKRATSIAAALATGAPMIVLEDPSASLDDATAAELARIVAHALEDRAWVLFASRAPLASALVATAAEAIVLAGSLVADRGAPAVLATRSRRYSVDAQGAGEALARAVAARGAKVESLVAIPGSARFVLELPEGATTRDLFACAVEVGAVVVELCPIARAFA
jgi:ABC-type multidrug transport system ATPase subunit